jgi:hypothetical protein
MNMVHPAYFCFLPFKVTRPHIQKIIAVIEAKVLTWNDIQSGDHRMGGRKFLFGHREIGHIHWNGNLDIVFGKQITERILKRQRLQRHAYLPGVAITLKIRSDNDILFALSLLRYAYRLKKEWQITPIANSQTGVS